MSGDPIYYLKSIQRNLKELARFAADTQPGPSIGSEVLHDNLDWLDCYIAELEKKNAQPSQSPV